MRISRSDWQNYIDTLARINQRAAELMESWLDSNPEAPAEQVVDTAYALATRYGEAAASLSCDMYDEIAEAQGARVPPAEPAPTATYGETAKAIRGTMKNGQSTVPATTARLVKQAGADTILQNAARDGAEFAWIPMGDTCAFCLTLASRGWQRQSKKARDRHASHIHANCDCEYCVRFDGKSTVQGYDPDALLEQYYAAEGGTPQEKINAMRRAHYAENAPTIRAQKRAAYAARREREKGLTTGAGNGNLQSSKNPETIALEDIQIGRGLGAARKSYDIMDLDTGEHFDLVDGTIMRNVKVFAGKGVRAPYRNAYVYADSIGGREEDWQHVKGIGDVDYYGEARKAEIHWSQCDGFGDHDYFIKKWLE